MEHQVPAECAVSFSFCWGRFSLWFATSRSQGLHGGKTEASISFAGFDETGQSCTSPSLRSISSMWCWLVCSSSLKTKTGSDRLPDSRITCKTTQNNKKEPWKTGEQIESITVWYLSMSACKAFAPIYSWYLTIFRSASLDVFLWGYGCMLCWRIAYLQYCNRRCDLISIYASTLCVRVLIWYNWLSTAMYNSESMILISSIIKSSKCFQHQNLEALEWGKVGVGMNGIDDFITDWVVSKVRKCGYCIYT